MRLMFNANCSDTQALFKGKCPRRFQSFISSADRKLQIIDNAIALDDLRAPPENKLEALRGKRNGQWSIRINDKWRICFRFEAGNAIDVEIIDYH